MRARIWTVASIVAALATALLTYSVLKPYGQSVPVVVAARDLPAETLLTPSDLAMADYPATAVHPLARTDPDAVAGRYLLEAVFAGEPLLDPRLADPEASGPLAAQMRTAHVAMFVPLPLTRGMGGAFAAGDRIDLIAVLEPVGRRSMAQTLVHQATVLEVRDVDGRVVESTRSSSAVPLGALLAVSPDDAARVAFALEHGAVYAVLAGRGPSITGGPVTWDNVYPGARRGDAPVQSAPGASGSGASPPGTSAPGASAPSGPTDLDQPPDLEIGE